MYCISSYLTLEVLFSFLFRSGGIIYTLHSPVVKYDPCVSRDSYLEIFVARETFLVLAVVVVLPGRGKASLWRGGGTLRRHNRRGALLGV